MKVYFLSATPAALTVNGAYFGIADSFERFADVHLTDNLFVQFTPQGRLPISFFLNEDIRFTPPQGCEVYLLKDAMAIYAKNYPAIPTPLTPIWQKQAEGKTATLFRQGALQLCLQSQTHTAVCEIEDSFSTANGEFWGELFVLSTAERLAVYNQNAECLLCERMIEFHIEEDALNATLPLSSPLSLSARCRWEQAGETLQRVQFDLLQGKKEQENQPQALIAYAFLQSVLIGADFSVYLCEDLQKNAAKLRAFLGEFVAVVFTKEPLTFALIKKRAERLFYADYFSVTLNEQKVTDLQAV